MELNVVVNNMFDEEELAILDAVIPPKNKRG
jgi:hypothetical protein